MHCSRFPDSLPDGRTPVIRTGFSLPPPTPVSSVLTVGLVVETASVFEDLTKYANIYFINFTVILRGRINIFK